MTYLNFLHFSNKERNIRFSVEQAIYPKKKNFKDNYLFSKKGGVQNAPQFSSPMRSRSTLPRELH